MQDIGEDTEWNDALRKHGIIPEKKKDEAEEALAELIEHTIAVKATAEGKYGHLDIEGLDEVEDDDDEATIREFRNRRIAEMKQQANLSKFGEVQEISAVDYVEKVNNAGEGIWVFLHLYKQGIPLCALINQYFGRLATKFPQVKFMKSISNTCIPNYPEHNLPTVFVYFEGQMKRQFVSAGEFGGDKLKIDELEWMLSRTGAFKTDIESDPRKPRVKDVMMSSLRTKDDDDDNTDDEDDW